MKETTDASDVVRKRIAMWECRGTVSPPAPNTTTHVKKDLVTEKLSCTLKALKRVDSAVATLVDQSDGSGDTDTSDDGGGSVTSSSGVTTPIIQRSLANSINSNDEVFRSHVMELNLKNSDIKSTKSSIENIVIQNSCSIMKKDTLSHEESARHNTDSNRIIRNNNINDSNFSYIEYSNQTASNINDDICDSTIVSSVSRDGMNGITESTIQMFVNSNSQTTNEEKSRTTTTNGVTLHCLPQTNGDSQSISVDPGYHQAIEFTNESQKTLSNFHSMSDHQNGTELKSSQRQASPEENNKVLIIHNYDSAAAPGESTFNGRTTTLEKGQTSTGGSGVSSRRSSVCSNSPENEDYLARGKVPALHTLPVRNNALKKYWHEKVCMCIKRMFFFRF